MPENQLVRALNVAEKLRDRIIEANLLKEENLQMPFIRISRPRQLEVIDADELVDGYHAIVEVLGSTQYLHTIEAHVADMQLNKLKEMGRMAIFLLPAGQWKGRFRLPEELVPGDYVFWFRILVAGKRWTQAQCVEFSVKKFTIDTFGGGV